MVTTGVAGGHWRATITPWGGLEPWDGSAPVDWFVAADDRWHVPHDEVALRQTCIRGTPVVETRLRIPGGDAVQRVWSVADSGGLTIIEIANESSMPIAVAITGGSLLSRRAPTSVAPQGIDLPADAIVFPIAHRTTVMVARAHIGAPTLPDEVPGAEQVARGWLAQTERASRLRLPDSALVDAVTAARCALLLDGPGTLDDSADALAFLLGVAELVRLGQPPAIWVPDIATQLERLGRAGAQIPPGVMQAVARVLHVAGEGRALADLRRMGLRAGVVDEPFDDLPPQNGRVAAWVESKLVTSDDTAATLMPGGFPSAWLGVDFEAHGLAIGLASSLSFAIRWHGERPAVLWEVSGPPMMLAHRQWSTAELAGEALLPPVLPPAARPAIPPPPTPGV